ncbi:NAD(P)H-dependent oxidoreductase [uncultured Algibacter sp.]|uniref:FMN-dependent NADH-azoreductase n=1 Tax=uncultured Algibacter sp. TaxID=298659 RepID=UPI0032163825
MNKVLIINSSVRNEKSHSRELTKLFLKNWKKKNPKDTFSFREVGLEEIPSINEKWISSAFVNPKDRTKENQSGVEFSDILIKEFKEHNIYVIATPMYNWSIPSGLKSYIDQLMRINETWKFRSGKPDGDYVGLLKNKKMFILSSRGDTGYGENEKNEHMNFQTTYLKFVFGIMGIKDVTTISLDNEEFGGEIFENSKRKIHQEIQRI